MESQFKTNFQNVRIHTDGNAAASAAALRARAFTVGQHIVFGSGLYTPDTPDGRRLLAHELTHVIQQRRGAISASVQRDDKSPPPTPAPADGSAGPPGAATPPPAPALSPEAAKELAAEEQKVFDTARGRVGQPAATVLFSSPISPRTKDSPDLETFSIGEVLDRKSGDPVRHGFDAPGPATAYAGIIGTEVGGATLQQDKFYFAAKLNPGNHKLRVAEATWTEGDFWKFWRSDHVYRVTPAAGVVGVTGLAGFTFPLNKDLEDDPDRTRFLKDPQMAVPTDAESMRQIAGVGPEGKEAAGPATKAGEEVEIPPERHEAFILGYFRARGLEALAANEKEAEQLAQTFKPTDPGSSTRAPSGVSPEVKAIIAADRELGTTYRDLLDEEANVEALLDFLGVCAEKQEFPPFYPIYTKPQKGEVAAMTAAMTKRRADVQRRKFAILSASPLIGQLVGMPDPKSRFPPTRIERQKIPWDAEIPKIYGGTNAFTESALAKPATPESDEEIRASFEKKLDAVRKAIRDSRSEMLRDTDFLLGLGGLRAVVERDLSRITGKNAGLKDTLKKMLASKESADTKREVLGIAIQIGLLFVPGGLFLSAMAGLAISGAQMAKDLRTWTVSQASVNPATALANQQQAEAALARSTIDLTINAVFAATEAINALRLVEAGREGTLKSALEGIEARESKYAAAEATAASGRTLEGTAVEEELQANINKMRPSETPGFTHEIPVEGDHYWRRTSDGVWCRYSTTPTNCLVAGKGGSLPDWLKKRFLEGEEFNKANRGRYLYNEVEVKDAAGNIFRLDSFDPGKNEIVFRRFTQFADVQETTAVGYMNEFTRAVSCGGDHHRQPVQCEGSSRHSIEGQSGI